MNQTMRKSIAAGLTALAIAATPLMESAAQMTDFKDVKPSAWYYAAVDYAAREGLFSGTSKTTFSPEKADSALMAEVKKLVQKEFPNATFKIMGGGHGWRGFTQVDSDLTLAQNARRIADTENRYLKEWYKAGDTFTYWISEPEPGMFFISTE